MKEKALTWTIWTQRWLGASKSGLAIHRYILRIFLSACVEVAPCSSEDVDEKLVNID